MKNVLLLKISLLVQIGEEIYISNFMLQSLHNEGLFMVWRWGIPGRWGNPLRKGEVHNREEGEMARKSREEGEIGAKM